MDNSLYKNKERARQLVSFHNLQYERGITPTDVDLFMDFGNKVFIVGEIKYNNKPCDKGQYLAILRFVDRIATTTPEVKALMFVAEHQEHNPQNDIDAASCQVREYRTGRVTRKVEKKMTVKQLIDGFLAKNGIKQKS